MLLKVQDNDAVSRSIPEKEISFAMASDVQNADRWVIGIFGFRLLTREVVKSNDRELYHAPSL
jgi:hypothetical protein